MRTSVCTIIIACLLAGAGQSVCFAQDRALTARQLHPWGNCSAGAWKIVRIVTETLDAAGAVEGTSITETKTTLDAIDEDGVSLFIEGTVEMVGKRLEAEPRCVRQGFRGEPGGSESKVTSLEPVTLVIEDQKIACQVQQVETTTPTGKTTTRIYYSEKFRPHVLKTESVTTDPEGKKTVSQTTVTVVAINLPWKVLSQVRSSALVHTVQTHAKGRTDTWSVTCSEVPGGVIHHASKEVDENGRLLRRSTLELVDYGLEPDDRVTGPFRRFRSSRTRKPYR